MSRRSLAQSRVHKLSSADLEEIAGLVHARYFAFHWVVASDQPLRPEPGHGGRVPVTPPDVWQLFELDEGAEEKGVQLDDLLRLKTVPGRLMCELARLKARAKQREVTRARNQVLRAERVKWEGSLPSLDDDGRERFNRKIRDIKQNFPRPNYQREIASCLRAWGVYKGIPSRVTLHRLSAGLGKRQLYAHILRMHLWKRRAFRFILP